MTDPNQPPQQPPSQPYQGPQQPYQGPQQPYPGAGYTDHAYGKPGQPPQGPPPVGTQRRRSLLLGLVAGLVIGAGGLGIVWTLSGSDGVDADAEAMCGIIERTPPLSEEPSEVEVRRWAVVEVAPSLAEADSRYQPLADKLQEAFQVYRAELDVERARTLLDEALVLCDDL